MKRDSDAVLDWVAGEQQFTRRKFRQVFPKMSGTSAALRLKRLVDAGVIRRRVKDTKEWFEVRR